MGNMKEDAREYDRQVREGTKRYDEEVGKWWQLDAEEDDEEENEDDEDEDEED